MSPPTWDEYLEEASRHLAESRRTVELGAAPPPPPARPDGPMPDERREDVHWLVVGYDQLASEVSARLAHLRPRVGSTRRPPPVAPPARYVDTPV